MSTQLCGSPWAGEDSWVFTTGEAPVAHSEMKTHDAGFRCYRKGSQSSRKHQIKLRQVSQVKRLFP
jgi:hypothetical protein